LSTRPLVCFLPRLSQEVMTLKQNTAISLYILNFALLFTHEIDSAFWQEWKLFGIPGGIQVFLVLNFLLLLVALWGFRANSSWIYGLPYAGKHNGAQHDQQNQGFSPLNQPPPQGTSRTLNRKSL